MELDPHRKHITGTSVTPTLDKGNVLQLVYCDLMVLIVPVEEDRLQRNAVTEVDCTATLAAG